MQNINLLSTLPPRSKHYLSAEWLALGTIVFSALLLLIYGLAYIPVIKQKTLLTQLISEKDNLNKQIEVLEKTVLKKTKESIKLVSVPKLSPYLIALAEATPDGLWLKTIQISIEDNTLNLSGNAMNFHLIPLFIKKLTDFKVFPKTKITTLMLSKIEQGEEAGIISFQLSREPAPKVKTSPNAGNKP